MFGTIKNTTPKPSMFKRQMLFKLMFASTFILFNINNTFADSFDDGMIAGLIGSRVANKQKCNCIKTENKPSYISYQTADTALENNPIPHISQNHQCYNKKIISTMSTLSILINIIILTFVIFTMSMLCISSTDEQRSVACGIFVGMLIDDLLSEDCDCD